MIAMDSSPVPTREYLFVRLGDDLLLSYQRADVHWFWRWID